MSRHSEKLTVQRVIFVDSCVQECQSLVNGLSHEFTAFRLNSECDGIDQITVALEEQVLRFIPEDARFSIHIFSHGFPEGVQLGSSHLYFAHAKRYAARLKAWFPRMRSSLFLYGHGIAESSLCEPFMHQVHSMTGANISTSRLKLGDSNVNPDWEMDRFSSFSFSSNLPTKRTSLSRHYSCAQEL